MAHLRPLPPAHRHSLNLTLPTTPSVPSTPATPLCTRSQIKIPTRCDQSRCNAPVKRALAALAAAALVGLSPLACPEPSAADTSNYTIDTRQASGSEEDEDYFQTVPQGLSSAEDGPKGPKLSSLLEGPKGGEVQRCARKCVPTCIRGGQGAPGLGPMSVRKEIVVFKEGYRTRQYCLSECIQVCSLSYKNAAP